MKIIIRNLVIPTTIISIALFTKWWYVRVIDGTDEMMTGFPLPFVCRGFHTSGSLQFFIPQLIFDVAVYFTCWLAAFYCINRFMFKIKIFRGITMLLYIVSGVILSGCALIAFQPDNLFRLKRNFEINILDSGYTFIWQDVKHPEYSKYQHKLH